MGVLSQLTVIFALVAACILLVWPEIEAAPTGQGGAKAYVSDLERIASLAKEESHVRSKRSQTQSWLDRLRGTPCCQGDDSQVSRQTERDDSDGDGRGWYVIRYGQQHGGTTGTTGHRYGYDERSGGRYGDRYDDRYGYRYGGRSGGRSGHGYGGRSGGRSGHRHGGRSGGRRSGGRSGRRHGGRSGRRSNERYGYRRLDDDSSEEWGSDERYRHESGSSGRYGYRYGVSYGTRYGDRAGH